MRNKRKPWTPIIKKADINPGKETDYVKVAILIVGTHRTGSSLFANLLSECGVYLGGKLIQGDKFNVNGYFENEGLYKINENILRNFGTSWNSLNPLPVDWTLKIPSEVEEAIRRIIIDMFKKTNIIAIKDPRLCRLAPLYEKIIKGIGAGIVYVRTKRPIEECSSSFASVHGMDIEKAKKLCIADINIADKYHGFDVYYNDLIKDCRKVINELQKKIGFDFAQFPITLQKFVDKNLRNFR